MEENKSNIRRVGNFAIETIRHGEVDKIRVRAVGGNFAVDFGPTQAMYLLLSTIGDDELALTMPILLNIYAVSSIIDARFVNDVSKLVEKYFDGIEAKDVSDDIERKELDSMRSMKEYESVVVKVAEEAAKEEQK